MLDPQTVIQENERLIWATINKLWWHDSSIDRDDLFQAACEYILKRLPQYNDRYALSTFLVPLIRKAALQEIRRNSWKQSHDITGKLNGARNTFSKDIPYESGENFDIPVELTDPAIHVGFRFEDMLESLPEHQARVVRLHIQDDLTFQQIADMDGITRQAVYASFRIALRDLLVPAYLMHKADVPLAKVG